VDVSVQENAVRWGLAKFHGFRSDELVGNRQASSISPPVRDIEDTGILDEFVAPKTSCDGLDSLHGS
jgi:hypothetical protein